MRAGATPLRHSEGRRAYASAPEPGRGRTFLHEAGEDEALESAAALPGGADHCGALHRFGPKSRPWQRRLARLPPIQSAASVPLLGPRRLVGQVRHEPQQRLAFVGHLGGDVAVRTAPAGQRTPRRCGSRGRTEQIELLQLLPEAGLDLLVEARRITHRRTRIDTAADPASNSTTAEHDRTRLLIQQPMSLERRPHASGRKSARRIYQVGAIGWL